MKRFQIIEKYDRSFSTNYVDEILNAFMYFLFVLIQAGTSKQRFKTFHKKIAFV